MDEQLQLHIVARIHSDFTSKFGIPRQSNLVQSLEAVIVFEPPYRDENALRGLEGYSHLWLIWGFSEVHQEGWSPTVKPPKLGGNTRMGVFATRSPFRPNPLGLSSVELLRMEKRPGLGTVLVVAGADLMDGSPIYDIKPYLSFTDSHPEAKNGFAAAAGGVPAGVPRPHPGGEAARPLGCPIPGPPTRVSHGPQRPLRLSLRWEGRALLRGGRGGEGL